MQNILCLQFNNYFNRILKKYSTIEDYIRNSSNSDYSRNQNRQVCETNFIPNDSVNTDFTLNWANEWNPDYFLVVEDNEIKSRWYVLETVRVCQGQYKVKLKRDTVADKMEIVLNSPCFVEKGFVTDENPLIFNTEDFNCNQIKKSEIPVFDKSRTAFIVLYYALDKKATDLKGQVKTIEEPYIDIDDTLDNWDIFTRYYSNGYKVPMNKKLFIRWGPYGQKEEFNDKMDMISYEIEGNVSRSLIGIGPFAEEPKEIVKSYIDNDKTALQLKLASYGEEPDSFESFISYNNTIIKTSDNKFYRIKITREENSSSEETLSSGDLFTELQNCFKTGGNLKPGWTGDFTDTFVVSSENQVYKIDFIEEINSVRTINFDFTGCQDVDDAVYGVLALPYDTYLHDDNFDIYHVDFNIMRLIALELCKAGVGQDKIIYDAQILPYSPVTKLKYVSGYVSTVDLDSDEYSLIKDTNNNVVGYALHPLKSKFSTSINLSTYMISNQMGFTVFPNTYGKKDYKTENQCKFYRVCSPNWNGQFEFNLAKNRDLKYFGIDCTYKPYQPYIHVYPFFNGLYGQDFGDARGLVCGGDFSFAVLSEKFEEYKLQNKNFESIFNRQIENMDVKHEISQKYGAINALLNTGLGAAAAAAGAKLGHPAAAVGGLISATHSFAGGVTGLLGGMEKHIEERDYAIDMHNFQLDNIKALPNSLAKVDAYNNNNKIWPTLELYSCTDKEIEIFRNKIKYEGMTVNALGKLEDYIDTVSDETFVKGKMIRLEGLNEENHFAQDIYNEVAIGLYVRR